MGSNPTPAAHTAKIGLACWVCGQPSPPDLLTSAGARLDRRFLAVNWRATGGQGAEQVFESLRPHADSDVMAWRANVLAGVYWSGSALFALWYLLIAGFRCDEGCVSPTNTWYYDRDAWQWDAIAWSGGAAVAFATLFAFAASVGSRKAIVLLLLHVGALAFPLVLGGRQSDDLGQWLVFVALLEGCGIAAIRAGRAAARPAPLGST